MPFVLSYLPGKKKPAAAPSQAAGPVTSEAEASAARRRARLRGVVAATATKLLPLVALLDAVQAQAANESVFRTRRKRIRLHLAVAYAELRVPQPHRQALTHAFHTLAELVREETRDISPDELRQAAKEVALATLTNAPALINVSHQARLLK